MPMFKNLRLGKKASAHKDVDQDPDFVDDADPVGESVAESVSESVVESVAVSFADDASVSSVSETVSGSSTDLSPDLIVATADGLGDDLADDTAAPVRKPRKSPLSVLSLFRKKPKAEDDTHQPSVSPFDEATRLGGNDRLAEITAEIGPRPRPLPVVGHLPAKRQYGIALTVMATSLAAAGLLSTTSLLRQGDLKERANVGTRTQLAAQNIMLTAQNLVVRADPSAYGSLASDRAALKEITDQLGNGTDNSFALAAVKRINADILPVIDRALTVGAEMASLNRQLSSLERNTARVYQGADQLAAYLVSTSTSTLNIAAANDMRVRAERIARFGARILGTPVMSLEPQTEFAADVRELDAMLDQMADPNIGLDETASNFVSEISESVAAIKAVDAFLQKYAGAIVTARQEVVGMRDSIGSVSISAGNYVDSVSASADALSGRVYLAVALAALGVGALILLALVNNRLTRLETWETSYNNKTNEKDIIDFMGEILPVELGDLNVNFTNNTTAMEGITGGLRSSVNEAVGALRDALSTVKSTASSVKSNVEASVSSSREMAASNDRQSVEIADVVTRVGDLTGAIALVSDNTARAADMMNSAKAASDTGARYVGQTNQKMSEIRANMQDVLKSVKHLGESSHEIGAIVEAIESITDRTQVIAVNASLEAAKAGAAGQGFQVLAGEVNRLAEQSNEALRAITALVQRIQGETAATIRVVEDSTTNVVEGARLSETANTELVKISQLSDTLHSIMNEIREQSLSQSTSASEVRQSMDRLLGLSSRVQSTVSQMVSDVRHIDASMGTLQTTVLAFQTGDEQGD